MKPSTSRVLIFRYGEKPATKHLGIKFTYSFLHNEYNESSFTTTSPFYAKVQRYEVESA